MKKKSIILSVTTCCFAAFTACDMDLASETSIPTNQSVQSVQDCGKYSNLFHAEWRGYVQNSYTMDALVQSGLITATADYGNTYGAFYRWDYTITDGAFSGCWSDNYNFIANANVLLKGAEALLADNSLSDDDRKEIRLYMGHAYFTRAYAYFELALHFCKNYDPSSAANEYGIPLVEEYNSTPSIAGTYPGRSTLEETYKQIDSDLAKAEEYVTTAGEINSAYITADVVKALKARIALEKEDYQTAISTATALVNSGTYPLMTDGDAYADMWLHDNGTEAIWQFAMVKAKETGPNALGSAFSGIIDKLPRPSYLPTNTVLNLYDKDNDIRYNAYFTYDSIDAQTVPDFMITYCKKWPGNPELYEGKSNNINKTKAFRISEMYLIAAEAYAMSGDETNASAMLNKLKTARVKGWSDKSYKGDALIKEIQDEYVRELFGEQPYLFDLKRWKKGLNRSSSEAQDISYLPALGTDMVKSADDHMWVWPIPKDEIDANPQIKGQQNAGY